MLYNIHYTDSGLPNTPLHSSVRTLSSIFFSQISAYV